MLTPLLKRKLIIIFISIIVPLVTIIANTFLFFLVVDMQVEVDNETSIFGYEFIVIVLLIAAPAGALGIVFGYVTLSGFRKSDDEIAVYEVQYINRFAYVEIIIAVVLIFIFYVTPWKNILPQVSGDWLTLWFFLTVITPLSLAAYVSFTTIRPPDSRNEFGFHFARKCMIVLEGMFREDRKDEVKKIQFLMIALK
jgi:hypothetical protein